MTLLNSIQRKDKPQGFLMSCIKSPNDYDHIKAYLSGELNYWVNFVSIGYMRSWLGVQVLWDR